MDATNTAGTGLIRIQNPNDPTQIAKTQQTSAGVVAPGAIPKADVVKADPAIKSDVVKSDVANWNVDKNQTVQGQVADITANNSKLMQFADAQARQSMAGRGLLNSSMAIGAGQNAVLQAALPIAQADAGTYSAAARTNVGETNTANRNFATDENLANRDVAVATNTIGRDFAAATNTANRDVAAAEVAKTVADAKLSSDTANSINTMMTGASETFSKQMTAIGADTTLTPDQASQQRRLAAEQFARTSASMQALARTLGANANLLDFSSVDAEANGLISAAAESAKAAEIYAANKPKYTYRRGRGD